MKSAIALGLTTVAALLSAGASTPVERRQNRPELPAALIVCHEPNIVDCQTVNFTLAQGAIFTEFALPGVVRSAELPPNNGVGIPVDMCFTYGAINPDGSCAVSSLGQTVFFDRPVQSFTVPPVCAQCFRAE